MSADNENPPPAVAQETPTQLFLCEINHLILHENQTYIFQAAPGCQACADYLVPKPALEKKEPPSKTESARPMSRENIRYTRADMLRAWVAGKDSQYGDTLVPDFATWVETYAPSVSSGAKSEAGSVLPQTQTVVEPSDRNALNLQLARYIVRHAGKDYFDAACRYCSHDGIEDFVCTYHIAKQALQDARGASEAVERDSPRQLPKSEQIGDDQCPSCGGVGWLQFDPPDERMCQQCKGTGRARYVKHVVLNPSSPLLETEREEDSAPLAQPGDARAKNPTGPMESI